MVPAYPPDPIRSVQCPDAAMWDMRGRPHGDYCSGPRFCPSRMTAALKLMRSGGTAEVVTAPSPRKPGRPKNQDKKLDEQARTDIVRKFKSGMKIASLAREYDVAATSVTYVLDRAGARNS